MDMDEWEAIYSPENRSRVSEILNNNQNTEWPVPGSRASAVLVPLVRVEGEPSLLFETRSRFLSRHSNQVSFPGGLAEKSDSSPTATALRETKEELGIEPEQVEIWGELNSLGNFVTPVIGYVHQMKLSHLKLNKSEVHQAFTIPLRTLADPTKHRYTVFKPKSKASRYSLPVFLGGPRRVWGLTAFILDMTLLHLLPNYLPILAKAEQVHTRRKRGW